MLFYLLSTKNIYILEPKNHCGDSQQKENNAGMMMLNAGLFMLFLVIHRLLIYIIND